MSSPETEREQKPKIEGEKKDGEFVTLKAVDQKANEVMFKVKKTTQMGKLKKSYGDRMGVQNLGSFRFQFDGVAIQDTDTPASLGMENDDAIDVFENQTGG